MYSVTQEDTYRVVADNIVMREKEIASYDLNISNYTVMLTTLPQDDWPENIVQYKGVTDLDLVPDEFDDIVNEYNFRDRIRSLIKTEKRERLKSYQMYQTLMAQLPADRKDQLIAEAIVRANGG